MVATFCLDTFWCGGRVAVNWSLEEGACSAFDSEKLFGIDWALNISSDVLSEWHLFGLPPHANRRLTVFLLPFPLLRELQLSRNQIWGLVATFSLGVITICMSTVRFATIEVIFAWTNVCMWPTECISARLEMLDR